MLFTFFSQKSEGDSWERTQLQHEVNEWKAKYIDVENLQEEQIAAQNRNALLRQEVQYFMVETMEIS